MKKLVKIALRTAIIVTAEAAIGMNKMAVEVTNMVSRPLIPKIYLACNKMLEQDIFPTSDKDLEELFQVGESFNEVIYGELRKLAHGTTTFTESKEEVGEAYAAIHAVSMDITMSRINSQPVTLN